ncbi:probable carboxylesterase 15 [Phalaenopsis equestris]|uniref:probable carboxylesterase 15 n=1 Tax=Phalaenopsis equestris TaxID=78828 RepID=UPI0009E3DE57|nr:probable carboxylesterase 15 [Phalaenopsis equestris]
MTSSPNPNAEIFEIEECRGVLRVFSDGSINRSSEPSFLVPVDDDGSIEFSDALFDPNLNLHLRLYRPRHRLATDPPKLPIFYYFHGGGFCIGSRTWPNFHNYCLRLASDLRSIIVSPDYRLAPEDRLPAAINDSFAAVLWLRSQALCPDPNPLLQEADFSQVFISGDSAGGNIAHHIAVRFGSDSGRAELEPVLIRGYVLLMPFFGGTQRTRSEATCPHEAFLNLEVNDRFWRLALPVGSTTDDPISNPFGSGGPGLREVWFGPMLVIVGGEDLLRDRAVDYAERLKEWGKPIEVVKFEGQQHGFFTIRPRSEPADRLMHIIHRFMVENGCMLG